MELLGNQSYTVKSVWLMTCFSDSLRSFPQKACILKFSKCHSVSKQISLFSVIITSKTNEAENMTAKLDPGFFRQQKAVT